MGNVVVYEWGLNSDFLKTVAGLPSWPVVLGTAVIMLIILYSAALSADAGERRGYNDIAFFIMGMVLPYIFPLVIVPAISPRDGYVPTPVAAGKQQPVELPEEDEEDEPDDDAGYKFDFFATDEKGERPGPFTLVTKTGNTYTIDTIRKLYPDRGVFVLQRTDNNADSGDQTLRIKYEQIEYFDKLT